MGHHSVWRTGESLVWFGGSIESIMTFLLCRDHCYSVGQISLTRKKDCTESQEVYFSSWFGLVERLQGENHMLCQRGRDEISSISSLLKEHSPADLKTLPHNQGHLLDHTSTLIPPTIGTHPSAINIRRWGLNVWVSWCAKYWNSNKCDAVINKEETDGLELLQ